MRKRMLALGLALGTGLGAIPTAAALAATGVQPPLASSSPPTTTRSSHTSNTVSGAAIVQTAMQYLGYPYTATGDSPSTGFSCIGFVSFVYRSLGIPLPGDLGGALAYAPQVPFSDLMPGDILYFQNTVWSGLSHAAIYLGGGRFIHAEWYNRGVVISSFNNDPVDGNYWIGKYLGANRPWGGAAIGAAPIPPSPPGKQPGNPSTSTQTQVASGPTATVTVSGGLNVRSGPSKQSAVVQVLSQGTTVVIVGKKHGWFKVQLPDGSVGWVVSYGVSAGTTAGGPSTTAVSGTNGVPSAPATGTNTLVGTQTAPVRQGSPKQRHPTTRSTVNGLRVHAAPSTDAPVVGTMSQNQKVTVLARSNGWMKVRLPDGTVGWVMASYTSGAHSAAAPPATPTYRTVAPKPRPARTYRGGHTVNVAVNLRSGPSLSNSVITVVQPGQTYQVLGYANGWVHVQLANGTVGWIKASLVSSQSTTGSRSKGTRPTYRSYAPSRPQRSARRPTSAGGSVLTAGVRVHSRPGVNTPVVTLAAAGTRVQVLGSSGGWALVRLPSGTTGYVLGSYVR